MRVIVVGGGRVGLETAATLDEQGHSVVVVERDPDRCAAIGSEYVATVIEGDGTDPAILSQADLDRADVVAALTGDQSTNLAVCLLADRLADVRTLLRVTGAAGAEAFEDVVDEVVYPERVGAMAAVNGIATEAVRALEEVTGALAVLEIEVAADAPVAGRTLADVSLPHGTLVVSDATGDRVADTDTELTPGETYLVAAESDVTEEVRQLFRG